MVRDAFREGTDSPGVVGHVGYEAILVHLCFSECEMVVGLASG
jgi:hypothetical protein